MGVDLTLLPEKYRIPSLKHILAHDRLSFVGHDDKLWDKIIDTAKPLEQAVMVYQEEGLEKNTHDPYGTPLTYIDSLALQDILVEWDMTDMGDWDRAIRAFVCALEEPTRIVLWWH